MARTLPSALRPGEGKCFATVVSKTRGKAGHGLPPERDGTRTQSQLVIGVEPLAIKYLPIA